jgi:uncharacterized membrane protein
VSRRTTPLSGREAREAIARLAWDPGQAGRSLTVLDMAVMVRHADGSFTLNREPFPAAANILGCTIAGFLAGLVLAAPFTGATIGAVVGGLGSAASAASVGIRDAFIQEVQQLMKPGTSALFVLDQTVDMEAILHTIRGLGGTVLKTNVDLERAKLIQSALAEKGETSGHEGR